MERYKKGITLVALVITVIILLILAGITIQLSMGQQGIMQRAGKAGKNYTQSAKQEQRDLDKLYSAIKIADGSQITLSTEELNQYIEDKVQEYVKNNPTTKGTILFEGNASSGDITFLDNHTIDEFESIRFLYGRKKEEGWNGLCETTLGTVSWNYAIGHNGNFALNGYGTDYISVENLSKTGFSISGSNGYSLCMVYGINY